MKKSLQLDSYNGGKIVFLTLYFLAVSPSPTEKKKKSYCSKAGIRNVALSTTYTGRQWLNAEYKFVFSSLLSSAHRNEHDGSRVAFSRWCAGPPPNESKAVRAR